MAEAVPKKHPHIVLLDTNAFIDYIKHEKTDQLRNLVKLGKAWIVITPYTLYEYLGRANTAAKYKQYREEILSVGEFWVLNVNHITEDEGFEYGLDFLFSMDMIANDLNLGYAARRDKLARGVYASIFDKFLFLAILSSCIYAYMWDMATLNIDSEKFSYMASYIDGCYERSFASRCRIVFDQLVKYDGLSRFDSMSGRYISQVRATDESGELLRQFIADALAVAEVEYSLHCKGWTYSDNQFDRRVMKAYELWYKSLSDEKANRRLYQQCKKALSNQDPVKVFCRTTLKPMKSELYRKAWTFLVSSCVLANGVIHQYIFNDIIDMTNALIVESLPVESASYITFDNNWKRFIKDNKDDIHYQSTIELWRYLGINGY